MILNLSIAQHLFNFACFKPNTKVKRSNDIYHKKIEMTTHFKNMIADTELNGIEKEILHMMQKGLSSNEIASLFNCSKEMINKHRNSILKKTNCTTMFDVFALGAKKGWI